MTFHHNLAYNHACNPRLGDNYGRPPFPFFDVRNNVMYNYGHIFSGMTGDSLQANYVSNYIRPARTATARAPIVLTDAESVRYHVAGNVVEGRADITAANANLFDRPERGGRKRVTLSDQPFAAPPVRGSATEQALMRGLEHAGATRPVRDAVDARIVNEVRTGAGVIMDSQAEVGGWPAYRAGRPPIATDRDGMPDDWERQRGLDPRNPSDASAAPTGTATQTSRSTSTTPPRLSPPAFEVCLGATRE